VSKADFEAHRTATPIDHPDGSVTKAKLEYPTEDVSVFYLLAIDKFNHPNEWTIDDARYPHFTTTDSFTDKAMEAGLFENADYVMGRVTDGDNYYAAFFDDQYSTADFKIFKRKDGTATFLASEAVDLGADTYYKIKISCLGSTIKGYRVDMATEKVSATDTDHASGRFGMMLGQATEQLLAHGYLRPASSPLKSALAIIEVDVEGSGTFDDPFRPKLAREITSDNRDLLAVTWGLFEHKVGHATMIVMITSDNPYQSGAIDKQKQNAKRVFTIPRDYSEAVDLYRSLKADYPSWLAGKDNFAYQALGWEILSYLQNADFYYGELVEHKEHYDQLKRAPSFEIERRLRELRDKLSGVEVLHEERDKHLRKVEEVLKKGW